MTTRGIRRTAMGVVMVSLTLLAVARDAGADPPPTVVARVRACLGEPSGRVEFKAAGRDGARRVYHARLGQRRFLVFDDPSAKPEDACDTYPIGRALARTWGRFGVPGQRQKAFAVTSDGVEHVALALRDREGRLLMATELNEGCSQGVTLEALSVFKGPQILLVRCRQGIGGEDYDEKAILYRTTSVGLAVLLISAQGTSTTGPSDEDDGRLCTLPAGGSLKVLEHGARPVIETFKPSDAATTEGVTGTRQRYVFDPDKARFVAKGAGVRETHKVKVRCR